MFANKQDHKEALSAGELASQLALHKIKSPWHIEACCALSGEGLYQGISWITQTLTQEDKAST